MLSAFFDSHVEIGGLWRDLQPPSFYFLDVIVVALLAIIARSFGRMARCALALCNLFEIADEARWVQVGVRNRGRGFRFDGMAVRAIGQLWQQHVRTVRELGESARCGCRIESPPVDDDVAVWRFFGTMTRCAKAGRVRLRKLFEHRDGDRLIAGSGHIQPRSEYRIGVFARPIAD